LQRRSLGSYSYAQSLWRIEEKKLHLQGLFEQADALHSRICTSEAHAEGVLKMWRPTPTQYPLSACGRDRLTRAIDSGSFSVRLRPEDINGVSEDAWLKATHALQRDGYSVNMWRDDDGDPWYLHVTW
jgi:hypothetical protein